MILRECECACAYYLDENFLGQLARRWTLFDPTSHDAKLPVTSNGFPQFLSSFFSHEHKDTFRIADTQTETHSAILTVSEVFALFFKVTKSSWAAWWQSLFTSLLLSPSPFLFICLEATHQRGSVMDKEILRHRLAMREATLLCAALYLKIYFCLPLFKPKCVDRVVFSCG